MRRSIKLTQMNEAHIYVAYKELLCLIFNNEPINWITSKNNKLNIPLYKNINLCSLL